jgi:hypothetical protein
LADALVFTDPREVAIRSLDGALVEVGEPGVAEGIQHFDVVAHGEGLMSFEPVSQSLAWVEAGEVVDTVAIEDDAWTFPLVEEEARVWVARSAYDASLAVVASLETDGMVVAAGGGWIVGIEDRELVVWSAETLGEEGRMHASSLRAPPFETTKDRMDPLRFAVLDETTLLVGNTFRGTLELRSLPTLEAVGGEEVVPLGAWRDLEGLR